MLKNNKKIPSVATGEEVSLIKGMREGEVEVWPHERIWGVELIEENRGVTPVSPMLEVRNFRTLFHNL